MNHMYQSDHWSQVRRDEHVRGTQMWNSAQQPWESGVVPRPAYASQFAAPEAGASSVGAVVETLAGTALPRNEFVHNNMQPYFRGTATQNVDAGANRTLLENFTGRGDLFQKKKEVQCFFEPTAGLTNICGMKNQNEVYLDHIIAPRSRNNEFPIDPVRVGRGLGQGFTAQPAGGFHQANTLDYIRPKTVDELRVATKPKMTYEGRPQGPMKGTTQPGKVGDVFKNRVDTFYEHTPDMWLKTTGAQIKESGRPIENLKPTARVEGHVEYKGIVASTQPGQGDGDDYGKSKIQVYDNERMTTETKTVVSNITTMVKALVAPLLDVMRHTPKEYTVDAPRVYGNMQAQMPEKPTLYDPVNHVMRTTIKETTVHDTTVMNLKGPEQGTVHNMDDAKTTVRETLPVEDQVRNVASHTYRVTVYNADAAKKTVRETMDRSGSTYGFVSGPVNEAAGAYQHIEVQVPRTQKQFVSDYEYSGVAESKQDFRPTDREAEAAAEIDGTREAMNIASAHTPGAGGTFQPTNVDMVEMDTRRIMQDSMAPRAAGNVSRIFQTGAAPITKCEITKPADLLNAVENRLDPSVLSSLKTNPYNLSINPLA